ncbi:hypothetical protein [Sphingomonas glacialis]|nr:hypothetical protein [Sphingomonas glacialis]
MPIDDILHALAASPPPVALDGLEEGVFATIRSEARMRRTGRNGLAAVVCAASLAGVASAALPAARGGGDGASLGTTALAPSSLLVGASE